MISTLIKKKYQYYLLVHLILIKCCIFEYKIVENYGSFRFTNFSSLSTFNHVKFIFVIFILLKIIFFIYSYVIISYSQCNMFWIPYLPRKMLWDTMQYFMPNFRIPYQSWRMLWNIMQNFMPNFRIPYLSWRMLWDTMQNFMPNFRIPYLSWRML